MNFITAPPRVSSIADTAQTLTWHLLRHPSHASAASSKQISDQKRQAAEQAERAYQLLVAHWQQKAQRDTEIRLRISSVRKSA
jgi:hypothetical protein